MTDIIGTKGDKWESEKYASCATEIFENQNRNEILEKRFGIPIIKESEGKDGKKKM